MKCSVNFIGLLYMLCANRGSKQSVDCPAQSINPRFALQSRPNPTCRAQEKLFAKVRHDDNDDSSGGILNPNPKLCGNCVWVCVAQSVDPQFAQGNPQIVWIHSLHIKYIHVCHQIALKDSFSHNFWFTSSTTVSKQSKKWPVLLNDHLMKM